MMRPLADALERAAPPRGATTAVCVPDGTRPVDVSAALAALRPHLGGRVTVVIGLGLHRRMTADELPRGPWPIVQHDPDDCVDTGEVDGIPGGVARHVADAEVVLGLGIVELHQYAGFSGGHKAVSVGCGARRTLDALHHRDRVTAPGVRLGRLEGNPFREAVDALGARARCRWVALTHGGGWRCGEPVATLREAASALDCWVDVPTRHAAAVLRVPRVKASSFYQASRAATYLGLSDDPPLTPNATLYLDAACPEGLGAGDGERAFAAALASCPPPWDALLTGPAPAGAGAQRAIMIAQLARRFSLVVCGVDDPAPLRAAGLEATRAPAAAVAPDGALEVADPFGRLPRFNAR